MLLIKIFDKSDKMSKKFLALITILLTMVAVFIGIYSTGVFSSNTDFNTKFISGTIHGNATLVESPNNSYNWSLRYNDKTNNISYAFFAIKDGNFFINFFKSAGFEKIESKTFNGTKWDIYFLKTPLFFDSQRNNIAIFSVTNSSFYYNYYCVSHKNGAAYFAIIGSNKVRGDNSLNSDLFEDFVEPLLNTIKLKNSDNIPTTQDLRMSNNNFLN